MSEGVNDKYIERIEDAMVMEQYEEAISQCTVALNVYDVILRGMIDYRKALEGIRSSASNMKVAAESAAASLKDEVGSMIVQVILESSAALINECSDGDDDVNQDLGILKEKVDLVKKRRQQAQMLLEEQEKKRKEAQKESGRDLGGYSR